MPLLNADTKRQATASLSGYAYQIWRSVQAWLDLKDLEAIDLEGNEDIDLLFPGGATSMQVKALRDPISLRSPDAVEAMNNLWSALARNPTLPFTVRFLTTAGTARERDRPFGDRKGVHVWQSLSRAPEGAAPAGDVQQLRTFLLGIEKLQGDLRAWLETATDEAVLDRLVRRLVWDVEADGSDTLMGNIDQRLMLLGESYHTLPPEALKVRPHLLEEVLKRATARRVQDRRLTRADLLMLFTQCTTVTVQVSVLASMAVAKAGPTALAHQGIEVIGALRRSMASLSHRLLRRRAAADVRLTAQTNGIVFVHGSTGMGKSTLVQQAIADFAESVIWLDFRNLGREVPKLLRQVTWAINSDPSPVVLVLDDVDFHGDTRDLQVALESLLTAISTRRGTAYVTGAKVPPQAWLQRLSFETLPVIQVPEFTEAEIDELLKLHGLQDAERRGRWAKAMRAFTGGHPTLVNAKAAAIASTGFPEVTVEEATRFSEDVGQVRDSARSMLADLPARERELLYRLSLAVAPLTRESVLRIAQLHDALPEPGNIFDRLAGPWIEKTGPDAFRVSPLILGAGTAANGPAWTRKMHRGIGCALMKPVLRPDEVSAILIHTIAGKDEMVLAKLCAALLMADQKKLVYEWLGWFIAFNPTTLKHRAVRILTRALQLRVASLTEPDKALACAHALYEDSRIEPEERALRPIRFMALTTLLMSAPRGLAASIAVSAALELDAMSTEIAELGIGPKLAAEREDNAEVPSDGVEVSPIDVGMLFFLSAQQRSLRHSELQDLLAQLSQVRSDLRDRLIAKFGHDRSFAMHLVNDAWLHEWRSDKPEWMRLCVALQDGFGHAVRWGALPLAGALATAVVRTMNENLGQPADACRYGEVARDIVGHQPELIDAIADAMEAQSHVVEALALRKNALSTWSPSETDSLGPVIGRRKAALTASKLGEWALAAAWFTEAAGMAREESRALKLGLRFDAAYADFKAGKREPVVDALLDLMQALREIPNSPEDAQSFRLHKVAGNMLAVLAAGEDSTGVGASLAAIAPGCCSEFATPEELKSLLPTPPDLSLINVCTFAVRTGVNSTRVDRLLRDFRSTRSTIARMLAATCEASQAVLDGRLAELPDRAIRLSRVLSQVMTLGRGPGLLVETDPATEGPADRFLVKAYLLSALVVGGARGDSLEVPPTWTVDLAAPTIPPDLAQWAQWAQEALKLSLAQRCEALIPHLDPHELGVLELANALEPDLNVRLALRSHVHLARLLHRKALLPEVASHLSTIIAAYWRRRAEHRFMLVLPAVTQPKLLEACDASSEGAVKLAAVLVAASEAIGAPFPADVLADLSELK